MNGDVELRVRKDILDTLIDKVIEKERELIRNGACPYKYFSYAHDMLNGCQENLDCGECERKFFEQRRKQLICNTIGEEQALEVYGIKRSDKRVDPVHKITTATVYE